MDFTEIAELAERFGRVSRRELRCHQDVARWLLLTLPEAEPEFPFTGAVGSLTGVPVIEHADYEPGQWELYEDGEVKASGRMNVPPWVTKPIELDIKWPSFSVISRAWPYGSFPINRPMALLGGIA